MFTIFLIFCQSNLQGGKDGIKRKRMRYLKRFIFIFLILGLSQSAWGIVRPSAIAGSWYPKDAHDLRNQVEHFLNNAKLPKLPEKITGLIVPHAGYPYSGQTAAYAFKAIVGKKYRRVVILAPSHYAYFYGASTFDVDFYETPLGKVPVDKKVVKALLSEPLFKEQTMAHLREHAIEIELPFLQVVLKKFSLVPILIGHIKEGDLDSIVNSIKKVLGKDISDTLFIASSDFTHFGPMYGYVPFKKDIKENIRKLDMGAVKYILKGDARGLLRYAREKKVTICGLYPIAIMLSILPKDIKGYLLHYSTSGEILGNYNNSVSYVAIVLDDIKVGLKEKKALLKLARFTLDYYFSHAHPPEAWEVPIEVSPALRVKKGVFVTLKKYGNLRGCIGFIRSYLPLYQAVMRATIYAAFADPRFSPLKKEELKDISIEISILEPPVPVNKIDEIKVGRDGLIIKKGSYQGLLLPQVATEFHLDRIKFLELTCRKAGLPPSCWKEGALIFRFSADVFSEGNIE